VRDDSLRQSPGADARLLRLLLCGFSHSFARRGGAGIDLLLEGIEIDLVPFSSVLQNRVSAAVAGAEELGVSMRLAEG
jgi:hypothetical protein